MALASACGGDSSNPKVDSNGGGSGGSSGHAGKGGGGGKTGTAGAPAAIKCGSATCSPVVLPVGDFTIPACCADEATNQCGLDSSVLSAFGPTFSEACQPLHQPGVRDAYCADSAKTPVMDSSLEIQFRGCCRESGTCGYLLDKLGDLFPIGLGCVDSSPFLDGGVPSECRGGGGEGGSAAAGGSPGGSSGTTAGGEGGVAGMAGE
jgi:hypothetical protein